MFYALLLPVGDEGLVADDDYYPGDICSRDTRSHTSTRLAPQDRPSLPWA